MTVLLDTNVVLDSLHKRESFRVSSDELLLLAEKKSFVCLLSANTLSDIFYLNARETSISEARTALSYLLDNFDVAAIDGDDCKAAMNLPIKDFEDALVVQCGIKYKVDYIITRDEQLQDNGIVKAISPAEFLSML
jgi:predicted nucleic acid-binding protein